MNTDITEQYSATYNYNGNYIRLQAIIFKSKRSAAKYFSQQDGSTDSAYVDKYRGVKVEFEVKAGTQSRLESIGVRNGANKIAEIYPDMPKGSPGLETYKRVF